MEYVIGIDSGGTHYRLKAASLDGECLGSFTGAEANHYHNTEEDMLRRIESHFTSLLATFGGRREDCRYIVCGTTGLDSPQDGEYLERCYSSLAGFNCPVRVINDAELAHYTVTGGEGVLIISGTGSIAFARARDGRCARSGGYLFTILGDEGSGSWVARAALHLLGRHYDGAVPCTPLVSLVEEELDIHDRHGLNTLAFRMGSMPWTCPSIGHLVDKAVEQGDCEAAAILDKASAALMEIVGDAVTSLHLDEDEPDFKLGLWGSNILQSSTLKERFIARVMDRYPQCRVVESSMTSLDGAVKMALELV